VHEFRAVRLTELNRCSDVRVPLSGTARDRFAFRQEGPGTGGRKRRAAVTRQPFRQRDMASQTAVASRAPRTTAEAQCCIQDATPSGVPER